ncbi:MAG TPA: tRNA pseudouridine synthase A [Saprospiraceae bacterium]|nr:tRNA pseudouridine synthase A [Saprospiraceae bacterium]HMQ85489.1 tRNA pseudouridine synthase A [Saprospiraceae bacterium]
MRYFLELAYKGTAYNGWQKQPIGLGIQEVLEQAFSTILGNPIDLTGCGRTDAGVHASQYFAHFDFDGAFPEAFLPRINKFLPKDIAIHRLLEMTNEAHARYDATARCYEYHIHFDKNPFLDGLSYFFPFAQKPDPVKMQAAAMLLLQYDTFFPFCKSDTDVHHYRCQLMHAQWVGSPELGRMTFHISANRFLRGMVRLIVGMCLHVGMDNVSLASVQEALDEQKRLKKSWSIAPEGLYLSRIEYPYIRRERE